MHAAKDDHLGVGGGGLSAQAQRIADKIGDILHFAGLIIMGKNNGFAQLL